MIHLLILLVVLGLVFYFIEMLPLAAPFPLIIKVAAILIGLFLVLQFLGIDTGFSLS